MKTRLGRLFVWFLLALVAFGTQGAPRPVLVHYMPWFVAKPFNGSWGYHWTLNSPQFNPDDVSPDGRRKIASHYYPAIGPYDSLDPVVLEYHVLLMKLGGIDGIVADWYGHEDYLDYGMINQRTAAIAGWARRAGLSFSICYEDRTVQAKVSGGWITSNAAVANAQQSMLYLQTNYFSDSGYLRLAGKPVLLTFGPVYFKSNSQWSAIFSVLSNLPAFFSEDTRYPVGMGAFDWPPMWLSSGGVLSTNAMDSYLANFESSAAGWPAFVSSAFPRFHDFYAQAGLASYGFLDDWDGRTFRGTLARAMTNHAAAIQLVTWNDFGEGTVIEPTREYGCRDLGVIQEFRRKYLEPSFSRTTNDLSFPLRVYALRRQFVADLVVTAELDRVFTNLVTGQLASAAAQLTGLETLRPALYGLSATANRFQVAIGGWTAKGVEVMESSDLVQWASVANFPPATNLTTFGTNIDLGTNARFYMVR